MFDKTKLSLIFKIIVIVFLFLVFLAAAVFSFIYIDWSTALLSLSIAVYIGYLWRETVYDYREYTEESADDKV